MIYDPSSECGLIFNRNITLLHFLIQVLEKKAPDVLKMTDELANVDKAAKVR